MYAESKSFTLSKFKALYLLIITNCRPRIVHVNFVSAFNLFSSLIMGSFRRDSLRS